MEGLFVSHPQMTQVTKGPRICPEFASVVELALDLGMVILFVVIEFHK